MAFFNKKEEVLKIQLTQYGKMALSQGKFRPTYYAFYDDDILYDTMYASKQEDQNNIKDRILSSARLKPQNIIYGAETKIMETNFFGKQHDGTQQLAPNLVDKDLLLRNALYDIEPGSRELPDFMIYLKGQADFDADTGIKKSLGSHVITEVDNIKCDVDVKRVIYTASDGPPEISGGSFTVTVDERFDFCKEEEYEVSFFEIDYNPASEVPNYDESEVLKNLYFQAFENNYKDLKLSDRFTVVFDEAVPEQDRYTEIEDECKTSSVRWGSVKEDQFRISRRDVYEDLDFTLPDCDDSPEGGEY